MLLAGCAILMIHTSALFRTQAPGAARVFCQRMGVETYRMMDYNNSNYGLEV